MPALNRQKRSVLEWNPFRPEQKRAVRIHRRVFERLCRCWRRWAGAMAGKRPITVWSPAVQVTADEREYVIQASLPRWMEDGVQVMLEPGILTLRAEAHADRQHWNGSPLQLEHASDVCEWAFRLSPDANPAGATAEVSSGRLCVRLPRQTGVRVVPVRVTTEAVRAFGLRDTET